MLMTTYAHLATNGDIFSTTF